MMQTFETIASWILGIIIGTLFIAFLLAACIVSIWVFWFILTTIAEG